MAWGKRELTANMDLTKDSGRLEKFTLGNKRLLTKGGSIRALHHTVKLSKNVPKGSNLRRVNSDVFDL
jgi:hypothetical protein